MWKFLVPVLLLSACVEGAAPADPVIGVSPRSVTGQERAAVMGYLRDALRDPDSARVVAMKASTVTFKSGRQDHIIGVNYNAKNGYGAYTGYDTQWFSNGRPELFGSLADDWCIHALNVPTPFCDSSFGTGLPN